MAAFKLFSIVLLAVSVSQGYASTLNQVALPETDVNFISHPFYSRGISIAKSWFDTLLTCHVVYPNGITYEAFPTNNLPDSEIVYESAVAPFNTCSVFFKHSDRIEGFSGTYELRSLIEHSDQSMTLTSQKFNVAITFSEVAVPNNDIVAQQ